MVTLSPQKLKDEMDKEVIENLTYNGIFADPIRTVIIDLSRSHP